MSSGAVRDPVADHLVTPQNAAPVVIDYQPSQVAAIRSMDPDLLLENIVATVKTAKAFRLSIVHSTVNVASGRGQPTVPELAELLEDSPPINRTSLKAWEDVDFLAAVRATGRRKLILCARDWAREETVADTVEIVLTTAYQDTFVKTNGTWRFAERRLYVRWTEGRTLEGAGVA